MVVCGEIRTHQTITLCSCQKNAGAADYRATRSPASSSVTIMASRRFNLRAKKMKCFKDDS